MSSNKKVRNATKAKVKGITFKSQLEKTIYNTLLQLGIKAEYEPKTFTLWDSFKSITPFYDKETEKQRDKRDLEEGNLKHSPYKLILKSSSVIGIRYTPDFYFKSNDLDIWIEAKGKENDVFYIKKKLFRKYLDDLYLKDGIKSLFFEVYTKKQLLQALEIIKEYEQSSEQNKNSSTSIT